MKRPAVARTCVGRSTRRLTGRLFIVLALAAAVSACGSTGATSSSPPATSAKTAASSGATPGTTTRTVTPRTSPTTAVKLTPTELDQAACRSFVSFAILIKEEGEDGSDAAGEVSGMVVEAKEAQTAGPAVAAGSKLLTDLNALAALTSSRQWKASPKEASTPQMTVVTVDCKAFPTSGT